MNVLSEGGAAGRIYHLYESEDLSFAQLFTVLKTIDLNFKELKPTEKFDGINIYFSKANGKALFARNKGHLNHGGLNHEQFLSYIQDKDKTLQQVYIKTIDSISQAIDGMKDDLFLSGKIFINCEIISKELPNIISYNEDLIVIHPNLTKSLNEEINSIQLKEIQDNIFSYFSEGIETNNFNIKLNTILNIESIPTNKERKKLMNLIKDYDLSSSSLLKDFFVRRYELLEASHQLFDDGKLYHSLQGLSSGNRKLVVAPMAEIINQVGIDFVKILGRDSEGFVFNFDGRVFKITGTFSERNQSMHKQEIKEQINPLKDNSKVHIPQDPVTINSATVIFPGGFKPPHKGHLNAVLEFLSGKITREQGIKPDKVVLIMSPAKKGTFPDLFDMNQSIELWNLYLETYGISDKVSIMKVEGKGNGPLTHASDFVLGRGHMKPESGETYIMATSRKDSGRYDFLVDYLTKKEKWNIVYGRNVEASVVGDENNNPLSSSEMRRQISFRNKERLKKYLPKRIVNNPELLQRSFDILFKRSGIHYMKESILNELININLSYVI